MAVRPAEQRVRLIDKPPSTATIGTDPLQFDGNLVEVSYDASELWNVVRVSGARKTQFEILFGSEEQTYS